MKMEGITFIIKVIPSINSAYRRENSVSNKSTISALCLQRKLTLFTNGNRLVGFSPAYAGKIHCPVAKLQAQRFQPRVCGENTHLICIFARETGIICLLLTLVQLYNIQYIILSSNYSYFDELIFIFDYLRTYTLHCNLCPYFSRLNPSPSLSWGFPEF